MMPIVMENQGSSPYQHLTIAEANEICCFVDTVRRALHIEHYRIVLSGGPPPGRDDANAMLSDTDGRGVAVLYVAADWRDKRPHSRRNSIIHEMLHAVHSRLTQHVMTDLNELDTLIGGERVELIKTHTRAQVEWWTDHMAGVIEALLPARWPTPTEVEAWVAEHGPIDHHDPDGWI